MSRVLNNGPFVKTLAIVAALSSQIAVNVPLAESAVALSATVEPDKGSIGDRLRYTIRITGDDGEKVEPLVRLRKEGPFEVYNVDVSKEVSPSGVETGVIVFTIIPFDTGKLKLPSYIYEWHDPEGVLHVAATDDTFVDIVPVLPAEPPPPDTGVIADIVEPELRLTEFALPLLLTAALAVAAIWLYRRYKSSRDVETPKPIATPYEAALAELERLKREDLYGEGKIKEFFSTISDAVRRYIEDEFKVDAMELTTRELSKNFPVEISDHADRVTALLDTCDMAKFAKSIPDRKTAGITLDAGLSFVRRTRRLPEEERKGGVGVEK